MDQIIYFRDIFESIPDYRKIVILEIRMKKEKKLLHECGFPKDDINRSGLEFKKSYLKRMTIICLTLKMMKNQFSRKFQISKWKLISQVSLKIMDTNDV